jgi:hypothetical protein
MHTDINTFSASTIKSTRFRMKTSAFNTIFYTVLEQFTLRQLIEVFDGLMVF